MRSFAIVLALVTWALSCFVAVSYVQARGNERSAATASKNAGERLSAAETSADTDNDAARRKTEQDEVNVSTDELMLERAQKEGRDTTRERQVMAADQVTLQADRIMQYTDEDFTRTTPNPQVTLGRERVDVYRSAEAHWQSVQQRDVRWAHALAMVWVVVAVSGFLAYRGRHGAEPEAAGLVFSAEEMPPSSGQGR